jgi:hypothetical protein
MAEEKFVFQLSKQEKDYLKNLAKLSIKSKFEQGVTFPEPPTEKMKEKFGAFVTLKKNDQLRGCIGHIVGDQPLWKTIINMAQSAAFQDPRFPPLEEDELSEIELEISILSPLQEVPDVKAIEPGRHGLVIKKGPYSGLLLPQVATEWGWDRETFLAQTCRKAGLAANAWKDPNTTLLWFESVNF